jgi:hypothetical protein
MLSSVITNAGTAFPESRLRARDGNPLDEEERPEGQSALSGYPLGDETRVRRLSESELFYSGVPASCHIHVPRVARSGAGRETVFRQTVIAWATRS